MSLPRVLQLVDFVRARASEGTFLCWFVRYARNILHPQLNPEMITRCGNYGTNRELVFDTQITRDEQRQIQVFRNTLRPGTDPEVALSVPYWLRTSDIDYFERQRIRLQELVNRWSRAFATATPHSERFQRPLFDRIFGYGSGDSWNFLGSDVYLRFYVVMMMHPAPYGIEIQIPPVMSLNPEQFLDRRPPRNRSMELMMQRDSTDSR